MGLLCLSQSGCIAGTGRGHPLHGIHPLPEESDIAQLSGYVRYVDDRDVSNLSKAFELRPGCHLVRTPTKWGQSEALQGAVMVETGEVLFAIPMKPAHRYVIDVYVPTMTGPTGPATLRAREWTPEGDVSAEFTPVSSQSDIATCQRAATP